MCVPSEGVVVPIPAPIETVSLAFGVGVDVGVGEGAGVGVELGEGVGLGVGVGAGGVVVLSTAWHMAMNMALTCLNVLPLVRSVRLVDELSHPLITSVNKPAIPALAAASIAIPLFPFPLTEKLHPRLTPRLDWIDGRMLLTLFASAVAWLVVAEHIVIGPAPWCRFQ